MQEEFDTNARCLWTVFSSPRHARHGIPELPHFLGFFLFNFVQSFSDRRHEIGKAFETLFVLHLEESLQTPNHNGPLDESELVEFTNKTHETQSRLARLPNGILSICCSRRRTIVIGSHCQFGFRLGLGVRVGTLKFLLTNFQECLFENLVDIGQFPRKSGVEFGKMRFHHGLVHHQSETVVYNFLRQLLLLLWAVVTVFAATTTMQSLYKLKGQFVQCRPR